MIKPYYEEPNIQIFLGDCLEVMKELPDKSIDLVLTDPPYGLNYRSNRGTKTNNLKDYIENDKPEEFINLISKVIPEFKRVLKDDSEIYWFCGGGGGQPVLAYAWLEFVKHKPDLRVKNLLIWDKQFVGLGWDWRFQYETIFQLVKGKGINVSENKNRSNILKCNNLIPQKNEHPTVKPVGLIKEILKEKSWGGAMILDPFLGSGTTLRACKDLGRKGIGIEISQKYCDIAIQRLSQEVFDFNV